MTLVQLMRRSIGYRHLAKCQGMVYNCVENKSASMEFDEAISTAWRAFASTKSGYNASRPEEEQCFSEEKRTQIDPFQLVKPELNLLAENIRTRIGNDVPILQKAASYFFELGAEGKYFRPSLLLLMANAVLPEGSDPERRKRQLLVAEITEMIHTASLLHDDVIDEADTRRSRPSLNFQMGNKLSILAGDFLLARSSILLASLRDPDVIEMLALVIEHLVAGEVMQMKASSEQAHDMDYYIKKTFYKTASLIALSSKAVATLGTSERSIADHAFEYGKNIGLAFQLVDDILDFTGSPQTLGKPSLSDVKQGLATAPILFAAEEEPRLKELIARKFAKPGDAELAVKIVSNTDGVNRARDLAYSYISRADQAVDSLPEIDSEHSYKCRLGLKLLGQKVVNRTK